MTNEKFENLEAFFDAEKADAKHRASDDLMARILQDANALQGQSEPVPEPKARPGFRFADIWRGLGGAPAMVAFAASTMLGVGLGYSLPLSDYLVAADDFAITEAVDTGTVLADIQTLYAED